MLNMNAVDIVARLDKEKKGEEPEFKFKWHEKECMKSTERHRVGWWESKQKKEEMNKS